MCLTVAMLALALCAGACKKTDEAQISSPQASTGNYTIAKICRNGTVIYAVPPGPKYAVAQSGVWTYLTDGTTPDTVCGYEPRTDH